MLEVAAQLFDTLKHLHMRANVCHLDLTITNVMLQDDRSNGWDVLRLIDFGFAQKLNKGKLFVDIRTKDVKPAEELHPAWEEYEAMIESHRFWEDACEVAMREGRPVKHPLIDRVRECSATPDAAADFFRWLFQFKPENRLYYATACHAYLRATCDRMKAAPSISWNSGSDVVEDGGSSGHEDGFSAITFQSTGHLQEGSSGGSFLRRLWLPPLQLYAALLCNATSWLLLNDVQRALSRGLGCRCR
ncbi:hypothetical protein WJX79_002816 [Trebouxia sp. C0005]